MDQNRLVLHGVAHGGVDGVAHPCGHGAGNLQVLAGNGFAAAGVGHHDLADTLAQILQVASHGQNSHQLTAHGDAELGFHHKAVQTAADADDDVAQTLRAEVHDPTHLNALGVDVQTLQALLGQPLIIVVALMLHAGVQRHHSQIVGVHDVVDIAGQAQREFGHGHQQGVAAAGCGTLHVHGGAAGGLTQGAAHVQTQLAQTFDQAQRNCGLTLAERRGGNGGDLNELAVGFVLQALHHLDEVDLGGLAIGDHLLGQQAKLLAEILHGGQRLFCFFGDLPILIDRRIQRHAAIGVHILAVFEFDCHRVFLLIILRLP